MKYSVSSIEIGLPLRGAFSMGEAVLHLDRGVFLGQPIIDTARLEHTQLCIGASFAFKTELSKTFHLFSLPVQISYRRHEVPALQRKNQAGCGSVGIQLIFRINEAAFRRSYPPSH